MTNDWNYLIICFFIYFVAKYTLVHATTVYSGLRNVCSYLNHNYGCHLVRNIKSTQISTCQTPIFTCSINIPLKPYISSKGWGMSGFLLKSVYCHLCRWYFQNFKIAYEQRFRYIKKIKETHQSYWVSFTPRDLFYTNIYIYIYIHIYICIE